MNWTIDEDKLVKRIDELIEERMASRLASIKLTDEELQDIHNLIKGQTNLITSLQDKGDVSNSTSAINSLCKLVSLVSKPID